MFKKYRVGELFEIHPTNAYRMNNADLYVIEGNTPVLSNSSTNNGVGGYSGLEPTEKGGIITFSDTTTGGDTMFYQADAFIGYPHVQGMYPFAIDKWDEKCSLYAISTIRKAAGDGWSYAVKFNRALVRELMIELPVVENPNSDHKYTVADIDWQYMCDRITELECERISELDAYLQASGLNEYELTEDDKKILSLSAKRASDKDGTLEDNSETEVRFGKFKATDLFDIKKGKRLTKADMIEGNINFVGSSASNNGITARISNNEYLHPAHTFTVSYNGSVGEVFLQDEPFWASDDVNVWCPKFPYNQRVVEYIMSVVRHLKDKYSYTVKWTLGKMQAEILDLPIKSDGTPDFNYMERYIRAMEKVVIADVVKYRDNVLETIKKVVGE